MDEETKYPTWQDVKIPDLMTLFLKNLSSCELLDYLILNKVFRFPIKPTFLYKCSSCGYTKKVSRSHDDYSTCEKCEDRFISCSANWLMGRDKIQTYSTSDGLISSVIKQMSLNYLTYFNSPLPDDFFDCGWEIQSPDVNQLKNDDANNDHWLIPPQQKSTSLFRSKFICGDIVRSHSHILSVCRAAILSPFLWDDCFDWKRKCKVDKSHESHIFPLLGMITKLGRDRYPGKRPSGSIKMVGQAGEALQVVPQNMPVWNENQHVDDLLDVENIWQALGDNP